MRAKVLNFAVFECLLELVDVAEEVYPLRILLLQLLILKYAALIIYVVGILLVLHLILLLLVYQLADVMPAKKPGIAHFG